MAIKIEREREKREREQREREGGREGGRGRGRGRGNVTFLGGGSKHTLTPIFSGVKIEDPQPLQDLRPWCVIDSFRGQALCLQTKTSTGRCPSTTWKRLPGRPRKTWTSQIPDDTGMLQRAYWDVSIRLGHGRGTLRSLKTTH